MMGREEKTPEHWAGRWRKRSPCWILDYPRVGRNVGSSAHCYLIFAQRFSLPLSQIYFLVQLLSSFCQGNSIVTKRLQIPEQPRFSSSPLSQQQKFPSDLVWTDLKLGFKTLHPSDPHSWMDLNLDFWLKLSITEHHPGLLFCSQQKNQPQAVGSSSLMNPGKHKWHKPGLGASWVRLGGCRAGD